MLDATDNPSLAGNVWCFQPGWSTPGKDGRLIYLNTCDKPRVANSDLRMSSVDCNTPITNGYSAAILGMRVTKICAHTSDLPARFYSDQDGVGGHVMWLHMPTDKGEYLMEIWAVRIPESGPEFGLVALIVRHKHINTGTLALIQ